MASVHKRQAAALLGQLADPLAVQRKGQRAPVIPGQWQEEHTQHAQCSVRPRQR